MKFYHLIIYVPESDADAVRSAAASAGAGTIGNYDSCSFSSKGTGRFRPAKGANPSIGTTDVLEEIVEERIEVVAEEKKLSNILKAILETHPYEEPAIHVLPMEDYKKLINS